MINSGLFVYVSISNVACSRWVILCIYHAVYNFVCLYTYTLYGIACLLEGPKSLKCFSTGNSQKVGDFIPVLVLEFLTSTCSRDGVFSAELGPVLWIEGISLYIHLVALFGETGVVPSLKFTAFLVDARNCRTSHVSLRPFFHKCWYQSHLILAHWLDI